MTKIPEDMDLFLAQGDGDGDVGKVYDRLSSRYDEFRNLWLQLAGRPTEEKLLEYLSLVLKPGQRVLDAGAGTGAMTRQMLKIEPSIRPTLLDLSPAMLAHAKDLPGEHIEGSVMELPFEDDTFDIVVSAWVIETLPDPVRAVSQYLRVLSPTGFVFYTFCSLPKEGVFHPGSELLQKAVEKGFAGRFLRPEETPRHECARSRQLQSFNGLSTLIVLRKCCTVDSSAPPVPLEEVPPTPF